jgi:hypothetical protein
MSGAKFIKNKFYKNRGDCCDFVEVHEVLFDSGRSAEIKVTWCHQLHDSWKKLCTDQFIVTEKQYPKWMHFTPRGERVGN